ncbi:MAG: ribosome silencing factor [Lachnospiraceae bacterium]|nr:ribosome silencing factor [Lachnospiraceae bacterium]
MESKEMARIIIDAMEEKKAEDIRVLDIAEVSSLGDYFIIASGNNVNQVQAITDEIDMRLGRAGVAPRQIEGYMNANWILMDYGDVIVHVFDKENRLFYDLERIWKDGKSVDPKEI